MQPEILHQNSQSFYPPEPFTLDHITMRHPVTSTILLVIPMGIFFILCKGYSVFLLQHRIPVKHLQCTVAAQHNNNKATAWAKATTNTNGFRGGLWHLSCSNVYVHSSTEKHREKRWRITDENTIYMSKLLQFQSTVQSQTERDLLCGSTVNNGADCNSNNLHQNNKLECMLYIFSERIG